MEIIKFKPRDRFVKEYMKEILGELLNENDVAKEYNKIPFNKIMMIFNILKPAILKEIEWELVDGFEASGFKEIAPNTYYSEQVGTITVKKNEVTEWSLFKDY